MNGNPLSLSPRPRQPSPPQPPDVFCIKVGEFGWLRAVHNGAPVLTAVDEEAQEWPTEAEALDVLANLPASEVTRRVVPRIRRPVAS
jgi:hypothetical protein